MPNTLVKATMLTGQLVKNIEMVARNNMARDPPVQHPEGCYVSVRLPFELFGFILSVCDQLRCVGNSRMIYAASLSAKESSLLGRSGIVNFGSIVPALKYFAIVLRDSPVRRLIG